MNQVIVNHMTGILKLITDKITFVSVSCGHQSTSALRFDLFSISVW
jgi:hypothetical protein